MLRFLLGLVITTVGIPLLLVFMMLDFTPDIPVEDYEIQDISSIIQEDVNAAIENVENNELSFSLKEANINNMIFNAIRSGANPDYNPSETCVEDSCALIDRIDIEGQEGAYVAVTGAWVKLYDDIISLNISAKAHYQVDLQTRLRLEFKVVDNADKFEISYHKIQVGNIPLPKAVINPIVNAILNQTDFNADEVNNEFLTVDAENLMILLDKAALVEELGAEDPASAFVASLLLEDELLQFNIVDEGDPRLELMFDIDRLVTENYVHPTYLGAETSQEVMDQLMNDVIEAAQDDNPNVYILEEDFNNLLYEVMPSVTLDEFIPEDVDVDIDIVMDKMYVQFADEHSMNFVLPIYLNDLSLVAVLKTVEDDTYTAGVRFIVQELSIGEDDGETVDEYLHVPYDEVKDLFAGFEMNEGFMMFDPTTGAMTIPTSTIQDMFGDSAVVDELSYDSNGLNIEYHIEFVLP